MMAAAILTQLKTAYGYIETGAEALFRLKQIYDINNNINMHYSKNGNTIVFTAAETYIRDILVPGHQPIYAVDVDTPNRWNKFKIIEIISNSEKGKEFLKDTSNRFHSCDEILQHKLVEHLIHMAEEYYNGNYSTTITCLERRIVPTGDWDMAELPGGPPTVEKMILKLTFTIN